MDEARAIERMERSLRTHHNLTVPISKLPPEVMTIIFACCLDSWHPGPTVEDIMPGHRDRPRGTMLGGMAVTHVCARWREIALGTPSLWHRPVFVLGPSCLKTTIARSKSTALSLILADHSMVGKSYLNQDAIDIVSSNMHRTRELDLKVSNYPSRWLFSSLTNKAPVLERLVLRKVFHHTDLSPNFLGGHTPNLRHLAIHGVFNYMPSLSNLLHNLVSFTLTLDTDRMHYPPTFCDDILGAIASMQLLEVLDLADCFPICHAQHQHNGAHPPVALPRLTHFTIGRMWSDACTHILAHLLLPTTAKIDVTLAATERDQRGLDHEGMAARCAILSMYLKGVPFRQVAISGGYEGSQPLSVVASRGTSGQAPQEFPMSWDVRIRLIPAKYAGGYIGDFGWLHRAVDRIVQWRDIENLEVRAEWMSSTWKEILPRAHALKRIAVDDKLARCWDWGWDQAEPSVDELAIHGVWQGGLVILHSRSAVQWFRQRMVLGNPVSAPPFVKASFESGYDIATDAFRRLSSSPPALCCDPRLLELVPIAQPPSSPSKSPSSPQFSSPRPSPPLSRYPWLPLTNDESF